MYSLINKHTHYEKENTYTYNNGNDGNICLDNCRTVFL